METHVNLIFYTFSHLNGMSILVKDDGAEWKKECGFEYHLLIFFLQLLIKIKSQHAKQMKRSSVFKKNRMLLNNKIPNNQTEKWIKDLNGYFSNEDIQGGSKHS